MSTTPVPAGPVEPSDGAASPETSVEDPRPVEIEGPADGADDVEVRDVVDGATLRRAPRYRAFFWTGAIVGLLLGFVFGLIVLSDPAAAGIDKPGVLFSVIVLGGVTVGLLLGGFAAIVADRRSVRRRARDSRASQA